MPIYVDNLKTYLDSPSYYKRWCHMMVDAGDSLAGLHDFAKALGLKREWFQAKDKHYPHYVLVPSKRIQAIDMGAIDIPSAVMIMRCRRS